VNTFHSLKESTAQRQIDQTFNVLGHDFFRELLGLVDDKAPAVGAPRDHMRISVPLDLVQHGVQLEGEGEL
jgi:hypothetical protein